MNFNYTYRDASGGMKEGAAEANSRGALFAQLKAKGITPVSVEESEKFKVQGLKGGEGSSKFKVQGLKVGLVAGVVLAIVVLAVILMMRPGTKAAAKRVKKPQASRLAPDVTPAKPSRPADYRVTEAPAPVRPAPHTNEYGYLIDRVPTKIVITNKVADADRPIEERVFKNTAEQKIAAILLMQPGEMLVGDTGALFGPSFVKALKRALATPITISPDDSEDVVALKQAVEASKAELKGYMDEGKDVGAMMTKERDELQELGLYRDELKHHINALGRDRTLREQDMKDFVDAANTLLAERGGAPLSMPRFAARRFALEKARENLQ